MTTQTPDAVREAIVKYTQHYVGCAVYGSWADGEPKCSCGLDEARASLAALDSRAGDAGEAIGYQVRIAYGEWHPALCSEAEAARMVANVDSAVCEMRPVYAATPAPAVDANQRHKWDSYARPRTCEVCGYEEHDGSGCGYRPCVTSAVDARALAIAAGYTVGEVSCHGPGRAWDWSPKGPMGGNKFRSEAEAWEGLERHIGQELEKARKLVALAGHVGAVPAGEVKA